MSPYKKKKNLHQKIKKLALERAALQKKMKEIAEKISNVQAKINFIDSPFVR